MKRIILIAILAAVSLAGCDSFKKENIQPPTPLSDYTPSITIHRLWEASAGDGAADTGVRMRPAYADGMIFAAGSDGTLKAFDAKTGDTVWKDYSRAHGWFGWGDKNRPDTAYSGGPAVGNGLLVVGTLNGHVYGYDAKTGKKRWKAALPSEVIGAPAVVGGLAVVRTEDGRVYGLDADTGKRKWANDKGVVPTLSLRGTGPLLVANGVVFAGSADGQLRAMTLSNGQSLWEQPLATGEGSGEIGRLDDADGSIVLNGTTLYAGAYHGELTAIDGRSGRPLWHQPFSTYTGLDVSGHTLLGVDDASHVWGFDTSTGSDMWQNKKLAWRWLSGPAVQGNHVVVGDRSGYVHWLQVGDGKLAGRVRLSHDAIRAQPLVIGDTVYVEDVDGDIAAYTIQPVSGRSANQ